MLEKPITIPVILILIKFRALLRNATYSLSFIGLNRETVVEYEHNCDITFREAERDLEVVLNEQTELSFKVSIIQEVEHSAQVVELSTATAQRNPGRLRDFVQVFARARGQLSSQQLTDHVVVEEVILVEHEQFNGGRQLQLQLEQQLVRFFEEILHVFQDVALVLRVAQ